VGRARELGPGSKVAGAGVYGKNRESFSFPLRLSQGTGLFRSKYNSLKARREDPESCNCSTWTQIFGETLGDSLIELTASLWQ
jgi:hypothetical protein